MSVLWIQILCFSAMPVGIYLLAKSIKHIKKGFSGTILLDLPYLKRQANFIIETGGEFSIWHKGPMLKRAPLNKFRPTVYSRDTREEIQVRYSYMGKQVNNFSQSRSELFTFSAPIGNYMIELKDGSSVTPLQESIGKIVPAPDVDLSKYSIEIRQSQPQMYTVLAIAVTFVGFVLTLGGFVFGILADQLF